MFKSIRLARNSRIGKWSVERFFFSIIIIYCWSFTTIVKEKKRAQNFPIPIDYILLDPLVDLTLSVNFECVYTKRKNI